MITGGEQAVEEEAGRTGSGAARLLPRRPWWVWAVPFAVVLGVLLVRNAFLFTTRLYEDADMGANSILIEQARRFTLLVGNYSREKFNHPGPAFLYVQSWGESLFWAWLHVVPTAWNGQLIAVYALNAVFAAFVVGTGFGWTRSVRGAAAVLAVVGCFGALHPAMFSSDWMPYVYVPAYFAFLVAIASVAAGRGQDAWIAAVSGWFLINGHACFLFFVPLLSAAALAAVLWTRYRSLRASGVPGSSTSPAEPGQSQASRPPLRALLRCRPRVWIPVAVISALFALPIVLELALHWPGNFGKYFAYSSSAQSGGHTLVQVATYTLWFWWPHAHAWAAPVVLYAAAIAVTWRLPPGPVRRFCVALLAVDLVSTAGFVAYTAAGVDELNATGYYIGYFYWSAPVILLLVIAVGVVEMLPARSWLGLAAAALAAVAACAAFAVAPQTRTSTNHTDPGNLSTGANTDPALPAGVARMAALAAGRPIVLTLAQHDAWPDMTGVLVQAERTGVRACVADASWEFMVTSQFICSPAELADGETFRLYEPGTVPAGMPVVFRLRRAIVTSALK